MDVERYIRNPEEGMALVGRKLDDLLWPPDMRAEMTKNPDASKLVLAKEIRSDFDYTWMEV